MLPTTTAADRGARIIRGQPDTRFSKSITPLFAFLGLAAIAILTLFSTRNLPLIGDEFAHLKQVNDLTTWIRTGAPFSPTHPAIPGYHFVIAAIAAMAEGSAVETYRGISLGVNLLLPLAALAIAWTLTLDSRLSTMRMAHVFFLAIAFPFLPLLYTDLFSAGVVLLSFALLFRKRYTLAGAVGTLSIAVRQNNILWLGLAFLLSVRRLYTSDYSGMQSERPETRVFIDMCARLFTFILGFLAFAAFWVWNGGELALADQGAHPPFAFHVGNIWSILIAAFFLFLPHGVAQAGAVLRLIREHPKVVGLRGLIVSIVYLITFTNTHPYNFLPWWLHNKFVLLATSSMIWKLAFLVTILYQILVFASTPMWRKDLFLLFPIAIAYLGASWLIEPRYFFIPLFLFALFRRSQERWVETALLVWNVGLSVLIFWGVSRGLWLP